MPVLYPQANYVINFFGIFSFNINMSIINLFIPDFLDKSYSDVYTWGVGLITDDDITGTYDLDNYFSYDAVYALLTGNQLNPFGFFATALGVAVDVMTTLQYTAAISAMSNN